MSSRFRLHASESSFPLFVLLTSTGTLVCCALPALFVTLGLGATFASLVSSVPQLVWLSEQKIYLFIFSGVMLALGGFWQWRAKDAPCPTDPQLGRACMRARKMSLIFYCLSLVIYVIGFFFAFIIPYF